MTEGRAVEQCRRVWRLGFTGTGEQGNMHASDSARSCRRVHCGDPQVTHGRFRLLWIVAASVLASATPTDPVCADEQVCRINARKRLNDTVISARRGERFELRIVKSENLKDAYIPVDATKGGFETWFMRPFALFRRLPQAPWFAVAAQVGCPRHYRDTVVVAPGRRCILTAPRDGRITLFVNDADPLYWNNNGTVDVAIVRLPRSAKSRPMAITPQRIAAG